MNLINCEQQTSAKRLNHLRRHSMKEIMNISIRLILVILFLFIFSCATTQQEIESPIVDAGYFTVEPPYGLWSCMANKEIGLIRFSTGKYSVFGGHVGTTWITVFREEVKQELWDASEEEVADDFRNQEENRMRLEGGPKGEKYKLEDVKKAITTVGGKKLYFMSYKISRPFKTIFEGPTKTNDVLYVYFPPGFKENHIFYGFLFSESHATGALVTFDVELIYPVIDSFKIKNP